MRRRTLRQILVVIRKELKDSLRDRRALFSIAFSIVVGPALVGFMMNRIADRQREAEHVEIPVVGQQHAPALVEWLRQQAGVQIVRRALEAPLRQIATNAGLDASVVVDRVRQGTLDYGYNAATNEYGNLLAMGVIDPASVVRCALQNAASVAGLMLTTACSIAAHG